MTSIERTPTTDEIRSGYSYYTSGYWHEETEEGTAEFDRWLAEHDAEVRRHGDPSPAQVDAFVKAINDNGFVLDRGAVRAGLLAAAETWQIEAMQEALRSTGERHG